MEEWIFAIPRISSLTEQERSTAVSDPLPFPCSTSPIYCFCLFTYSTSLQPIPLPTRRDSIDCLLTVDESPEAAKVWEIQERAAPHVPQVLNDMLEIRCAQLGSNPRDSVLIETRMKTILLTTLERVKKAHLHMGNVARHFALPQMTKEFFSIGVPAEDFPEPPVTGVKYALQYGQRADRHSNLYIIQNETRFDECTDIYINQTITTFSHVHYFRKAVGMQAEFYGLHTDSYEFLFYHITGGGQYTVLAVSWKTNNEGVISILSKIMDKSVALVKAAKAAPGVQDALREMVGVETAP